MAQLGPTEYPNETVNNTTADALIRSVREADGLEQDIQCGNGVYAVTPLEIGDSRLFIYRIYAVGTIPEVDDEVLLIENIRLKIGDFYQISYPNGFQEAILEGEYLEVHITFYADCYGFLSDEVRFKTSAETCRYRILNDVNEAPGAQLTVRLVRFNGYFDNVRSLGNALPGSYDHQFRNSNNPANPRRMWLDIVNRGTEDLIIDNIQLEGPAFPLNWTQSDLEYGAPIPAGAQRRFFLEIEPTECNEEAVGVKIFSNRSVDCSIMPNEDEFKVVIRPATNCLELNASEEEIFPRGKALASEDAKTSFRLYPTLVREEIMLGSGNNTTTTRYQVIDTNGRTVVHGSIKAGATNTRINTVSLSPGAYFIRLEGEESPLRFLKVR